MVYRTDESSFPKPSRDVGFAALPASLEWKDCVAQECGLAMGATSAWRSCPKDCCEDGTSLVTEVTGLYPSLTHLTETGVVSPGIVTQGGPSPGGHQVMSRDVWLSHSGRVLLI